MNKITLKNIKHYPTMSEETYCFEATLYEDNKKIGRVSNRGTGGCHDFDFNLKKWQELDQWCKNNLPKWKLYDDEEHDTDLEMHISHLITEYLDNQELKKLLRRSVIVVDDTCSNGEVYEWKFSKYKGRAKQEVIGGIKNHVENNDKFKNPIVLNSLSFDNAFEIFTREVA